MGTSLDKISNKMKKLKTQLRTSLNTVSTCIIFCTFVLFQTEQRFIRLFRWQEEKRNELRLVHLYVEKWTLESLENYTPAKSLLRKIKVFKIVTDIIANIDFQNMKAVRNDHTISDRPICWRKYKHAETCSVNILKKS